MRNFVDIVALCREHMAPDQLNSVRSCYLNCLSVGSIYTSTSEHPDAMPKRKVAGFVIQSFFFATTDEAAADSAVLKLVDIVTEIQESHHFDQAEIMNVQLRRTLKALQAEEREAEKQRPGEHDYE